MFYDIFNQQLPKLAATSWCDQNLMSLHTKYIDLVKCIYCIVKSKDLIRLHEYAGYCPLNSTWKDVFCLAFYFKWKYLFWLTIFYKKPFFFSVFCFQICTLKLNLRLTIGLTYTISIVKWFFLNFCLRKYFLLFFADFWIVDVSQ